MPLAPVTKATLPKGFVDILTGYDNGMKSQVR